MAVVTSVAPVSRRYYEKRNRSVAELNIIQMSAVLGKPKPTGLSALTKPELISLALALHNEFPE